MTGEQPLVVVGRVVKPHGIRGEVVVEVLSDVPDRFDPGRRLQVGGRPMTVTSSRPHQGRLLVRFEAVTDRTAAEGLRGRTIEAEPVDTAEHDVYFAHELVGTPVTDERGAPLGRVSALVELPASAGYDLLEVRREDGSTWLLPAADEYVEVEEGDEGLARLRLVDPPAGLVDAADDERDDEAGDA